MRIVATPAYLTAHPEARTEFESLVLRVMSPVAHSQPSMIFGDPEAPGQELEDLTEMDDGSKVHLSMRVPVLGFKKLWCKRDDHPDGPVYTFLLPSDY